MVFFVFKKRYGILWSDLFCAESVELNSKANCGFQIAIWKQCGQFLGPFISLRKAKEFRSFMVYIYFSNNDSLPENLNLTL